MHDVAPGLRTAPSLPAATDKTNGTSTDAARGLPGVSGPEIGAVQVATLHAWLLTAATPASDVARVDTLRALEEIKAACAALQAQVLVELHDDALRAAREHAADPTVHRDAAGRQVPVTARSAERDATASTVQQAARALRLSPHRTRTLLGAAHVWHEEMPHTLTSLRTGMLSEERALLLVKETTYLAPEDRTHIDDDLCADSVTLRGIGTRRLVGLIRARANELDPAALVRRAGRAATDRRVSIRPAPDAMAHVTALLPMAQGVQVYAALRLAAESVRHTCGDGRSTGQIMADTLVERTTGQEHAAAVPVAVNLVVSDATLLGGGHEPAVVLDGTGAGHGVVPAAVARHLVAGALARRPAPDQGSGRLQDTLVRRADPAPRPRPGSRARRRHRARQRAGALRRVQPSQGGSRLELDGRHRPGDRAARRDHHDTDRSPLSVGRTSTTATCGPCASPAATGRPDSTSAVRPTHGDPSARTADAAGPRHVGEHGRHQWAVTSVQYSDGRHPISPGSSEIRRKSVNLTGARSPVRTATRQSR